MSDVLRAEVVTEINPEGENFDPKLMECVETVEGVHNTVVRVVQRGYMLHDMLRRPARVEVGMDVLTENNKDIKDEPKKEVSNE